MYSLTVGAALIAAGVGDGDAEGVGLGQQR